MIAVLLGVFACCVASSPPSILLEAHCDDSIRMRIAPSGEPVAKSQLGALSESCMKNTSVATSIQGPGSLQNGNLQVDVSDSGRIVVTRVADATQLLTGMLPAFSPASCGHGYFSFAANFSSSEPNNWYGLGQLESPDQGSCHDGTPASHLCGAPLNRNGQSWEVKSTKYYIGIPWLFNRNGYGVFFNQPGDGEVDLTSGVGVRNMHNRL
jgi:alpha-glucosidase (family GH31 glycosyl hydrolase)